MAIGTTLDQLGRKTIGTIMASLQLFLMVYLSLRAALKDQSQGLRNIFNVVSMQVYFTAWQAMSIIAVLAVGVGSVLILQGLKNLALLGGTDGLGSLLIAVIVRELGPLLVALIVIARSGTAVASEIGTMKVNREIDALVSLGIHPLSYIVFPRLVGGTVSVVCLAFYFNVFALLGGFLVIRPFTNVPFEFYIQILSTSFEISDIAVFFAKNLISGALIFTIPCYLGLQVKRSPHEVPQVTTKSVVSSIFYIIVFHFAVTILYYFSQLQSLGVL